MHAGKVGWRVERNYPYHENSITASISPIISPRWLYKYSRNKKIAKKTIRWSSWAQHYFRRGSFIKRKHSWHWFKNVLRPSPWNSFLREQIVMCLYWTKEKALHFLFFAQALLKGGFKKKKKKNDTRDYIQYPVINQNGKKNEKECIYIHI